MVGKSPRVSIIIPVYNVEKYVGRCIESVNAQTYNNIELIIINDASTDNSMGIINETLKQCRFDYKIMNNSQNCGISMTRNSGMSMTTGDYLTFIDSDDSINCCYIEHLVRAAQDSSVDLVMSDYVEISNCFDAKLSNVSFCVTREEIDNKSDLLRRHGYAWGYLYKRSAIECYNLSFIPVYMEDVLWNAEYMLNVNTIAFVSSAKYYFLKRPGSLSRPGSREKVAINTFLCGCKFDEYFLLYGKKKQYAELLQDRRYVWNCYWGEIKALGFSIPAVCQSDKTNRKALRTMIRKSKLGLKEKMQEYVLSFSHIEKLVYRLFMD